MKVDQIKEGIKGLEEKIRFVAGVQKAFISLDDGKGLSIDEVEHMIEKWSSK
jgi:hypothetical protein